MRVTSTEDSSGPCPAKEKESSMLREGGIDMIQTGFGNGGSESEELRRWTDIDKANHHEAAEEFETQMLDFALLKVYCYKKRQTI